MPRPAQPSPGVGPPASTHTTPPKPSRAMSDRVKSFFRSRMSCRAVGIFSPCVRRTVESAFGSQPICITRSPFSLSAAERLDTVVDFPMPPLPYTAILIIASSSRPYSRRVRPRPRSQFPASARAACEGCFLRRRRCPPCCRRADISAALPSETGSA